jgi:hypothetical protein
MGRYYFNIKDGRTLIHDPDGDDLFGEAEALMVIKETVADIAERPKTYGGLRRWMRREFVVTDERGGTVLTVPVAALLRPN